VLVVFRGADAYVGPSLYTTKKETGKVVPTWNYVMVQARGQARLRDQIAALEGKWKVSQNQPEVNRRSVAAGFRAGESTQEMADLVRTYGKTE
jgi:transcriptional regulator